MSGNALALTLGRLNVQSSIGERLRAEIPIQDAAPADLAALRVRVANSDAFKAAGLSYSPAVADLRTSLQRRPDGRYVVQLSTDSPMSDPFVDLLLEASWTTGRIVRDFTILLDPPSRRNPAAVAPTPAQSAQPVRPTASARPPVQIGQSAPSATAPRPVESPAAAGPTGTTAPAARPPVALGGQTQASGGAAGEQVTVQRGDTASKLAEAHRPAEISLDQMLVAMLRANPQAFINGNINLLRAGSVLNLPGAQEASGVAPEEAKRVLVAQSRNFNDYRKRLADLAPAAQVAQPNQKVAGRVEAAVEDRNANAAAADKLRISQGLANGQGSAEQIARARQAQDANARVAELSRNINDLNKLQASSSATATGPGSSGATTPAAAPAAATAAPALAASAATPVAPSPAAAASAAVPASTTTADANAASTPLTTSTAVPAQAANPSTAASSATAAATPRPAPVVSPEESRGWLAGLLDNPLMLAAGALIALLVAFLLYRVLGRRKVDAAESSFLESKLPKDSFFGANGGQSVDTRDRGNSQLSSLSYSPSQLDAGDVDPVAEADVYLAYGRDLQAEEILREALRVNPDRVAIHLKLLEIHAKRHDPRAFEAAAQEVKRLTHGQGTDWDRAVELGQELDPANPLYVRSGSGQPVSTAEAAAFAGSLAAARVSSSDNGPPTIPVSFDRPEDSQPPSFVPSVAPLDFDLDMPAPTAAVSAPAPTATVPANAFDFPTTSATAAAPAVAVAAAPQALPEATPARPVSTPAPEPVAFPQTVAQPRLEELTPSWEPTATAAFSSEPGRKEEAPSITAFGAPNFGPTEALDLHPDFDTAPGALEMPTAPAALAQNDEFSQPATLRAGLPGDSGFIEFDMSAIGGLSGRSRDTGSAPLEFGAQTAESPHAIKLSLARELKELGDIEGARSLVEEVAAESSGDVNVEAKQLLGELR